MQRDVGYRAAVTVFLLAVATRFVGVFLTTVTSLNSYAQADADGFARSAAYIANGLRAGTYTFHPQSTDIYGTWGTFLAPFWVFPGPSRLYARVGMAILGAYAVYNVFVIARAYASLEAAYIAAAPMLLYPSFIFVHSSILREAIVLFGITTAARLLIVPPRKVHPLLGYAIAGGFLWMTLVLRPENQPVFLAILALAVVVKYRAAIKRTLVYYLAVPVAILAAVLSIPYINRGLEFLNRVRLTRARGRTAYLEDIFPNTIPSALVFSWIGAAYFLFAPFPWMVSQIPDFVASIEGLLNLLFAIASLYGFRTLFHRNTTVAVALAAGLALGAVLYGIANANAGTVVRQRQMMIWVVFVFGGIGIDERFNFSIMSDWRPDDRSGGVVDD